MLDSHNRLASLTRLSRRSLCGGLVLASIVFAALPSVAVATHNQDLEHAHFINQPGTTLGGSFNTSDSNLVGGGALAAYPALSAIAGTQNAWWPSPWSRCWWSCCRATTRSARW